MLTPGSAVPAWAQELLPQFFKDRPALTEATWAFIISLIHASYLIFTLVAADAIGDGVTTLFGFFAWFPTHWFVPVVGYLVGGGVAGSRASQAHAKAVDATNSPKPPGGSPE